MTLNPFKKYRHLLVLILFYIGFRATSWDCPPMWDGRWDYLALLAAKNAPFDLLNYTVDGHISQGFMIFSGLPYAVFKQNYYLFNIWLTSFGVVAICAFYLITEFFLAGRLSALEITLFSAIFAFHPSVMASMSHFCFDMGILLFFLCYWLCLLKGFRIAAIICGVLLVFSKETSFLLLPLPFAFCCLLQAKGARLSWIRKHLGSIAFPYLAVGYFVMYKVWIREEAAVWVNYGSQSHLATLMGYFDGGPMLSNFLGMIFLLNFNWLISILCFSLPLIVLWRKSATHKFEYRIPALMYLMVLAVAVVLTLVRPFSNVRYVLLIFPLMILCVGMVFHHVFSAPLVRRAVLVILCALMVMGDFRTLDPVSRSFFGTFSFGDHKLLSMNRRTQEFPGEGRDELVYNLEFMMFSRLINCAMKDIRPVNGSYIICNIIGLFHLFGDLDSSTYELTFQSDHVIRPNYACVSEILNFKTLPTILYYFDLPNTSNEDDILRLRKTFPHETTREYRLRGYTLRVLCFSR